jgi:hypothetical protein
MAKVQTLTKEDLFNLVAPIHIFHKADVCFKEEARKAFRILKKVRDHEIVLHYFDEGVSVLNERNVIGVDHIVFWKVYNRLFEELVTEYFPEFKSSHDRYGAKCFLFEGKRYLAGDDYDCFPFYADVDSLKQHLQELQEELCA